MGDKGIEDREMERRLAGREREKGGSKGSKQPKINRRKVATGI